MPARTIVFLFLLLCSCTHVTMQRGEGPKVEPSQEHRIHSFLFALIRQPASALPTQTTLCPGSRIETVEFHMTPTDVLIATATLGLYVPQHMSVACAPVSN